MRDLINTIDKVLTEGVGLSNRKPGEKFKNSVGDIVTFQGLKFYPESGKFPSGDVMSDAMDTLKKQGMNIHWTNQASGAGGFGIATFTGEDGKPYYLGRFFREISPNRVQNNFPHDAIPGGFKFQSRVGQKENTGYKPSEILTQFQNNTPESIYKQVVAKFGADSSEAQAMAIFIKQDIPVTVPRGNMNPDAFRDYFAEMLQPMALVLGKRVSGNAAEAADIFFGPGQGYGDCTISFNQNTIGGLYDSLLVNPKGKQIKLSSKGKEGASASVVNLLTSVRELSSTSNGQKLLATHADTIDILNTINKSGHFGAPLDLAQRYGMITADEAQEVMQMKNLGPSDPIKLSPRLQKMYNGRKARDPGRIIPIEHMISAIAYPVADYVNKNTNFGQAAAEILNNAALVQMYTDTTATDDSITITRLTAVYPSKTVTGVLLDASKVYFSTGGKGNYTFTILKNGAAPANVNAMDAIGEDMDSLTPIEPDQGREVVSKPLGTLEILGRARR